MRWSPPIMVVLTTLSLAIPSAYCAKAANERSEIATDGMVGATAGATAGATGHVGTSWGTRHASGTLEGTDWSLAKLHGGDLVAGTEITLAFQEDALRGNAGCNIYGANRVEAVDGKIETSAISRTEMACGGPDGGVMRQEERYLRALDGAAGYRLDDGRLELQNASGETTLVFEKEAR